MEARRARAAYTSTTTSAALTSASAAGMADAFCELTSTPIAEVVAPGLISESASPIVGMHAGPRASDVKHCWSPA
jgi:hypothetical protein